MGRQRPVARPNPGGSLTNGTDEFDFRIVGSVGELERMIRGRAGERATARLVAGFCWPWSDPDDEGQLVPDVRVGDWSMPWNARDGVGRLGPAIPKSDFWASTKEGIDQIGCVYTAQGFEFDYVGVIFGPDLVYRPMDGAWVGQRDQSHDRVVRSGVTQQQFTDFRQEHLPRPADPRPPRLLCVFHGHSDPRFRA